MIRKINSSDRFPDKVGASYLFTFERNVQKIEVLKKGKLFSRNPTEAVVKRKYFWIEYGVIALVALIGSIIRYFLWETLEMKGEYHPSLGLVSFFFLAFAWEFFRGVDFLLDRICPYDSGIYRRMGLQLLLGVVFMLLMNRLILLFAGRFIEDQISRIFSLTTYATYIILSFLINSVFFGKHFFDQWKSGILKTERLEKEKSKVQFENLKNQLNPHFLFNSLSSLHSLIIDNPALASDFVTNLSKVYRYVLQNEERLLVPLREELEFIGHFVFLLETRFQDGIKIEIHVSENYGNVGVVPVTLQVLLENAVKHNVIDVENPLKIRLEVANERLVISNTRNPKMTTGISNGKGLQYLKSLYSFLSNNPVEILRKEDSFVVKIPLLAVQ